MFILHTVTMGKHIISLIVADDQTLFRKGLIALLSAETDINVVGEAANGAEAVERCLELSPDLVIMNVMMPIMDGITAAQRIKAADLRTELLFLSSTFHEDIAKKCFECGGRGYLLKDCQLRDLLHAVRKAAFGEYYISGAIGPEMVDAYVNSHLKSHRPSSQMTPREREIALLLADGYSTKEAARILNISPKTAETHRATIMKKLNAKNVTDIVKYCIRNHIIEA